MPPPVFGVVNATWHAASPTEPAAVDLNVHSRIIQELGAPVRSLEMALTLRPAGAASTPDRSGTPQNGNGRRNCDPRGRPDQQAEHDPVKTRGGSD